MNFCYWCEDEIDTSQNDFLCGLCVEAETRFLAGANSAGKLWRELFG